MQQQEQKQTEILRRLLSDDSEVRAQYLKQFQGDVNVFVENMALAFVEFRALEAEAKLDEKKNYVVALVYAAITLHIVSLKLFLSGYIVPAGGIFRQVCESVALALLCSGKKTKVLERFIEGKYSAKNAIRDVIRNSKYLGLNSDSLKNLKDSLEFYHKYSHITLLTLANLISFSEHKAQVGASFDKEKIDPYRKEINIRVNLSRLFPNVIQGVIANIKKW
jgi:hypothetical protein